jgi:TolA-binding protein
MTDKTDKPAPVYKVAAQEEARRLDAEVGGLLRQKLQMEMQRDDLDMQIRTINGRVARLQGKLEGVDLGQRLQAETFENEKTRREHGVE